MSTSSTSPPPLNERLYRTEAIILGRTDYGEADRIFTVFTPNHGKLRVIGKGVRRPLSRLGPHLEYFDRSLLVLAKGRDLDVITGAETIDGHGGLGQSLDAFGHASHLVEMLNRLTQDRQEQRAAYDLLASSLRLLADGVDPFPVTRHFELALLSTLGFRPELYRCLVCNRDLLAEPNGFSSRLGGTVCSTCALTDAGTRLLSINAQKFLRMLDRRGLSVAARLPTDQRLRDELEGVLTDYIRQIAERDLSSLKVWRAIRDVPSS